MAEFTDWEVGKTYKTRGGDDVKIERIDLEKAYPIGGIVGGMVGGIRRTWSTNGFHCIGQKTDLDLMPPEPALQDEPALEFTLDWPHGHMTRDGREAEAFCERDGVVYGRIKFRDGTWMAIDRRLNGRMFEVAKNLNDIINRPPPKPAPFEYVGWGIIDGSNTFLAKDSEENAWGSVASGWRVVKVKITEIKP